MLHLLHFIRLHMIGKVPSDSNETNSNRIDFEPITVNLK